ncbi:MAG TPA: hemolysin III family protein [Haliscomenobacter sp.]|uniref:PAQR family membrane homeostasis protein TrhA n=1 Tax=Haliscomenobacter sp. TaxID=2717303 RepID=UPI002CB99430|nr:hemolysin III family protein [Haliscomenobacter sp.]HOY17506.1 hemolysin III family protein [Haliscomenobacter sp.]HPH17131.1 hemolysin III family protein [Haliscomenobacter sp.]
MSVNTYHPTLLKQEIANSVSHGFGILFGIVCIPLLLVLASKTGNITTTLGVSIYAFSFLMVYTSSTLYHGFQQPLVKNVLQILDHISIYFLIAGSYTPFILIYVFNSVGITLLCVLWGLTLVGTVFKIFFINKFNFLSTIIYLLMGWLLLAAGKTFFVSLPSDVLSLIVIGGVLYSFGVIFYLWEKFMYHHLVWHLFVLAASICHFAAVILAVS